MEMAFIMTLTGILVAGTVRGGIALRNLLRRRRIERRLDGGVGSFRDGEHTTIVGKVRGPVEPLASPLSGHICVAYRVVASVARAHGEVEAPSVEETRVIPFDLVTDHGVVRVEAATAVLQLPLAPIIPRRVEREAAFLRACGFEMAMREVSCREAYVEDGRRIAVHGVMFLEVDQAPNGYRDTRVQARLHPHPEHGLTIGAPR